LNALHSEKSPARRERYTYGPLSNTLNYGLECLWEIDVDGVPERSDRIVFVPWDEDMPSDRVINGSLFRPDVILIFATACDFRGITDKDDLMVSHFVDKAACGIAHRRR